MVQSNAPAEIYQLHILLLQINPPIWRRLHVRSDSSIATLHEVLQIAFDWSDFHLHRFVIRGKEYGLSRIGCTTFEVIGRVLSSQVHERIRDVLGDVDLEEAVDRLEAYERFRPDRFDRRRVNRRLKQYALDDEGWRLE
jgi:hypothetical protein